VNEKNFETILPHVSVSENTLQTFAEILAEDNTDTQTSESEYIIEDDNSDVEVPITVTDPSCEELLQQILEQLQLLNEKELTVSANSVPADYYVPSVSENNITVTVSQNTVSENSIENAIVTTKLKDYGLTDSLLLIIVFILLIGNILTFIFLKGGK
jgi:hypothetical protein